MPGLAESYKTAVSELAHASDEDLQEKIWVALSAMREEREAASRFDQPRFDRSVEQGLSEDFKAVLTLLLDRLNKQLHALICGTAGLAGRDRNALMRTLGVDTTGRAAVIALILTSYAGVPPAIAPAAAVYISRRIVQPTLDQVCEAWSASLKA